MDIEHLEPRLPQSLSTFAAAWKQTAKWRSEKLPSCCRTYLSKSSPRWAASQRDSTTVEYQNSIALVSGNNEVQCGMIMHDMGLIENNPILSTGLSSLSHLKLAFSSGEGMYMYVPNISEDSHVFPGLLFPGHSKSFSNNSFRLAKSSCAAACNTIDTCPVIARCARCARCFTMGWRGRANAKRLASKSTCIYESYMNTWMIWECWMINFTSSCDVLWVFGILMDFSTQWRSVQPDSWSYIYFSVDHPRVFDLLSTVAEFNHQSPLLFAKRSKLCFPAFYWENTFAKPFARLSRMQPLLPRSEVWTKHLCGAFAVIEGYRRNILNIHQYIYIIIL